MENIKGNIEDYVKRSQTTIAALAKSIGISRSAFYDKLSGKRPWLLDEAIALADCMGCTVTELLTAPKVA